jgi:hypothetical protein
MDTSDPIRRVSTVSAGHALGVGPLELLIA